MSTMDKANAFIASGAILSPAWLPLLTNVSEVAALLLPVAGLVWLIVQIYSKVRWRK